MERVNKKKILVTGGAGFIGSHLVDELIKGYNEVYVIDIKIQPQAFFSVNNLSKKVYFEQLDIRNRKKVRSFFRKFPFDYVFHLAAEPIVQAGYEDPYTTFETNIMGTIHILEAVRESASIKGIIFASSDKAYGKTKIRYTEHSRLHGDHPYDVSKSSADLICQTYHKTYQTPVVITRFGNVYGEGDLHFDRLIPGLCKAILKNEIFEIRSDGNYVRDYLYVKDVVKGYMLLLQNIDRVVGQAFNFSSPDSLSVLEAITRIEKIIKKKILYNIHNTAKNEIPYQHLDDKKIKKLGWKNDYTVESVFKKVLSWYKEIV